MYLYHLISIDLQLSRSCNSMHCKAYTLRREVQDREALDVEALQGRALQDVQRREALDPSRELRFHLWVMYDGIHVIV
jgi:hypothetical protein